MAFCAVLHQPHPKNKKIKRCCRLVVLPDYQGIGIGTRFLNAVSEMYVAQGYDFSIVTSAKNMIASLHKSDKWVLVMYGISPQSTRPGSRDFCRASLRQNVKTARFFRRKE